MIFRQSSIDKSVLSAAFQAALSKKFRSPRKRKGQRGMCPLQEEPVLRRRSRHPHATSRQTLPPSPSERPAQTPQPPLLEIFPLSFPGSVYMHLVFHSSVPYIKSCSLLKTPRGALFYLGI